MRSVVRKLALHTLLGLAAVGGGVQACAQELGQEPAGEQAAELTYEDDSLRDATRKPLVDGIVAAENQLFTSTGRLLVSGDEGIYEIVRSASGSYESRVLHEGENCFFGGLTEQAGTIYANCYDFSDSALFAARLTDDPEFRLIYRLPGTALANGLASDSAGSLFVASSFAGRIIRLVVAKSDPLSIEGEDTFDGLSGLLTNGLEYFEHDLYWTSFASVNVAEVRADGRRGRKRTLCSALTFFDDLYVDASGILVADYINGTVVEVDPSCKLLGATPNATFEGPSSVQRANGRLGLSDDAVVITERTANRVSVLEP